jgi:hypothetical protein
MTTFINKKGLIKIRNNKFADDNEVYSFKGRNIDLEKPVYVYRNLHKEGIWYSVKQNNLVVAHAQLMVLGDCKFMVNEKGRQRVLKNKQKNVHAFIKGFYTTSGMGTTAAKNDLPAMIEYNPYCNKTFICSNLTVKPYSVKGAMIVILSSVVRASYTD